MKLLKLLVCIAIFSFTATNTTAQTADEIINTYIENIGGQEAWSKINSVQSKGIGKQQGIEYPFVATFMKDGRTLIDVDLQGNSFIVEAFDGETSWAMNFQTQKPEALDSEASINYKNEAKDYMPDAFMNYKEKGYKAELVGKETWEGTDCFKIKLIKNPVMVDGKKEENIAIYYFDAEEFIPIAKEEIVKSGQGKGGTELSIYSDYQEVADGLYMPFSEINKYNGQVNMEVTYKEIVFNVKVDDNKFKMPEAPVEVKKN